MEEGEYMPVLCNTNEVIEAYATTGVHHKLYYLDQLKERTIYCDTDAVV